MCQLLFMDESGHDHKVAPYEVRGGLAIDAGKLWAFVQDMHQSEIECFGERLNLFGTEIKGKRLLEKARFEWARQAEPLPDEARRKHARSFLAKGLVRGQEKRSPSRDEFTAFGQASILMAQRIFRSLWDREAVMFAAVTPRQVHRPATGTAEHYLRKDLVFLLERFFYFLEERHDHGLLIMDESESSADQHIVRKLESYFQKTVPGRQRTTWIAPSPFFVSSEITFPIHAADVFLYCVNWGFRLPARGMNEPVRTEIAESFGPWVARLQYAGRGSRDGTSFDTWGIVYVADPYEPRRDG